MSQLAVIKTGGKQYLVHPGQKLKVEELDAPPEGAAGSEPRPAGREARPKGGTEGGLVRRSLGKGGPSPAEVPTSRDEGGKIVFDNVLLVSDDRKIEIGTPLIKGAQVEARVLKQGRNRKVIVFRYHSKTRYRKKKGHRQYYTEVEIQKIVM